MESPRRIRQLPTIHAAAENTLGAAWPAFLPHTLQRPQQLGCDGGRPPGGFESDQVRFHLAAANASTLIILPAASNASIAALYRFSFAW